MWPGRDRLSMPAFVGGCRPFTACLLRAGMKMRLLAPLRFFETAL
jgi:hypothetical protein